MQPSQISGKPGVPETHQKTSLCAQGLLHDMSKGAVVLAELNLSQSLPKVLDEAGITQSL